MGGPRPYTCPIQCGQCCIMWHEVPELAALAPDRAERRDDCPYETPTGCSLPRDKRPFDCVAYLCEIAEETATERITAKRGWFLKIHGYESMPRRGNP